jgi:serine/threonine protein kinase
MSTFQLVEAVAYVHTKGIVHSNLSTTNVLVHRVSQTIRLIVAESSDSQCQELNLYGRLLPDTSFLAPLLTQQEFDLPEMDVFSLGVLIYIILSAGLWTRGRY